jgi:hypothetical protein
LIIPYTDDGGSILQKNDSPDFFCPKRPGSRKSCLKDPHDPAARNAVTHDRLRLNLAIFRIKIQPQRLRIPPVIWITHRSKPPHPGHAEQSTRWPMRR